MVGSGFSKNRHRLWHSADDEILAESREQILVERLWKSLAPAPSSQPRDQPRSASRFQEFLEDQRSHMQILNPPHRHRELVILQKQIQQRPRRQHMQARQFLMKITQLRKNLRCRLNLIEKQQRLPLHHWHSVSGLEQSHGFPHGCSGKKPRKRGVPLEIQLQDSLKRLLGQGSGQIRFPHLPRPAQDQWLSPGAIPPLQQFSKGLSFHSAILAGYFISESDILAGNIGRFT